MANVGRGNLFKRKDGKYLIYIPLDLAEDSMFPFRNYERTKRGTDSIRLRVSFKIGDNKLIVEKWEEPGSTKE
jgi:hypothetical protein